MRKLLFALFMLPLAFMASAQGDTSEKVVTFRFVSGNDMFFIPWGGNGAELDRLYSLVDEYRTEIMGGTIPIYVDGYCASLPTAKENLNMAFIRANRVKSELITRKGLIEANFITKNRAAAYAGNMNMVVITLRIPVKTEVAKPQPVKEEPKPAEKPKPQPEPVVAHEPESTPVIDMPAKTAKPYCFAVRTNLLYDAFLLPTLGVEWRVTPNVGIKVDGSRAHWGDEHGKVQKIWLVNPEVRWYMGESKRCYTGVSGNFGEYNIYKGMLGGLFSDDTGYQGKLWNAGLTAGYQLYITRSFSLDFNLGLGYTRLEYDNFNMKNDVRVYKEKEKTKNFFGPTQAGISLVWTIDGNK